MQKRTNFFDSSLFNTVPDKPLVIRNKPHNNQLCTDLSRFISAYPVVSHFLRFAWQTTNDCVHQMSANTIFGRYDKDGKDKNLVTSVEALNIFNATINKIFRKEGDNK